MKIAIIVNPLIPVPPEHYGGIERIVFMLIRGLQAMDHDVTLFAHPNSEPGCRLIGYGEHDPYDHMDFVRINWLTSGNILGKFDLVHTFGRMSNIALLMFSGIHKVVSYQLPPTLSQIKKAVRLARSGTLHFTACSNFIADQIRPFGEVTTIYNGVDLNTYDFSPELSENAPLVFLGRIQQEKGTDIAIRLALETGHRLVIAGNIPDEPAHQQYFDVAVKPFIDQNRIRYIGPVNNAQKNKLLGSAKAFLMPVTWDEPFGIVMAEALACGTPVIGFRKGAVPEIVEDGVNGFICDTFEAMCNAVAAVSNIDRHRCRKSAALNFSAQVITARYEQLYKQLTSR
ncbi:glycosyltransferase family 4 protein [Mucilaginibacter sp.]|uniref:glycosyltransferase family 4 protein n=1 Tax=Mucilaginibacter sp. TaxID=1882438 RepID=UPI0035BC3579